MPGAYFGEIPLTPAIPNPAEDATPNPDPYLNANRNTSSNPALALF